MQQNTYSSPQILIVGAGAVGLVAGYHLHLAGAKISFLDRPQRFEALSRPQILYSYDDATLKHFSGYAVISQASEAQAQAYDFVVITLDGSSSRSAEGKALLNDLGNAIRDTSAVVISGGIGFELRKYIVESLGLGDERVLGGAFGSLAHQVALAKLPAHAPTDPAVLAQADIAYRHNNEFGFFVEDRFPAIAERFVALYNACGVSKCAVFDTNLFEVLTLTRFPIFAGSELMGWPPAVALTNDKEAWTLTVAATQEVARLRANAKIKDAVSAMTSSDGIAQWIAAYEADAMPLDLHAFHSFHHGGKVAVQDLKLMQDCVTAGERQGKPMVSLKELLAKLEAHRRNATER